MLRVHGQDRFKKQGQTVLQMAAVVAHRGTNPIQIHYASLLLQVGIFDLSSFPNLGLWWLQCLFHIHHICGDDWEWCIIHCNHGWFSVFCFNSHKSCCQEVLCGDEHVVSGFVQTVDLNVDEDTLMRLASFYRSSLAETTTPSRLIYYDRFEIHPIKVHPLLCFSVWSFHSQYSYHRCFTRSFVRSLWVQQQDIHYQLLLSEHITKPFQDVSFSFCMLIDFSIGIFSDRLWQALFLGIHGLTIHQHRKHCGLCCIVSSRWDLLLFFLQSYAF